LCQVGNPLALRIEMVHRSTQVLMSLALSWLAVHGRFSKIVVGVETEEDVS
jgi:hypothetical protein